MKTARQAQSCCKVFVKSTHKHEPFVVAHICAAPFGANVGISLGCKESPTLSAAR
jgi:hypothetical protein